MRQLLQDVPIFAGMAEEALQLLLDRAREHIVAEGEIIVTEGETSNRFYIIKSGAVRVWKRSERGGGDGGDCRVKLATLGPKDFFGEMCILETRPRSATVQAIAPSVLFSISSLDIYHLFQQQPAQYGILLLNIARDLSRRLRRLDELFAARH